MSAQDTTSTRTYYIVRKSHGGGYDDDEPRDLFRLFPSRRDAEEAAARSATEHNRRLFWGFAPMAVDKIADDDGNSYWLARGENSNVRFGVRPVSVTICAGGRGEEGKEAWATVKDDVLGGDGTFPPSIGSIDYGRIFVGEPTLAEERSKSRAWEVAQQVCDEDSAFDYGADFSSAALVVKKGGGKSRSDQPQEGDRAALTLRVVTAPCDSMDLDEGEQFYEETLVIIRVIRMPVGAYSPAQLDSKEFVSDWPQFVNEPNAQVKRLHEDRQRKQSRQTEDFFHAILSGQPRQLSDWEIEARKLMAERREVMFGLVPPQDRQEGSTDANVQE